MNPMANPLTAAPAKSSTTSTEKMAGKMAAFGATVHRGKTMAKKQKPKKITRQLRELAKKQEAEKQLMLDRARATSKNSKNSGRKSGLKGRGRSKSNSKQRKSKVAVPEVEKTSNNNVKEQKDNKTTSTSSSITQATQLDALTKQPNAEQVELLKDNTATDKKDPASTITPQSSENKEEMEAATEKSAKQEKKRRASFWTSTLTFEPTLPTKVEATMDSEKQDVLDETRESTKEETTMDSKEQDVLDGTRELSSSAETAETTETPRLRKPSIPNLTTKLTKTGKDQPPPPEPPSTSRKKSITTTPTTCTTPTTTTTTTTTTTSTRGRTKTKDQAPPPPPAAPRTSVVANNRRARLLAMQKRHPPAAAPPSSSSTTSSSEKKSNNYGKAPPRPLRRKESTTESDQKTCETTETETALTQTSGNEGGTKTSSTKISTNKKVRRKSLTILKRMRQSHVEAKTKKVPSSISTTTNSSQPNNMMQPKVSPLSHNSASTDGEEKKDVINPLTAAPSLVTGPIRPRSKAPGPTDVESTAHRLEMESKQLPVPKEVQRKMRQEQRSRANTATEDRDPMLMAVANLKHSIALSTEKANTIQRSIVSQQKELADVLVLLRKQDRAAKLLANYAMDGVNNPLMLMQEIHGILG